MCFEVFDVIGVQIVNVVGICWIDCFNKIYCWIKDCMIDKEVDYEDFNGCEDFGMFCGYFILYIDCQSYSCCIKGQCEYDYWFVRGGLSVWSRGYRG